MEDRFAGIRDFVLAVDKSISKLGARLGVQLLHRTTRRIDLTSEGEAYLLSCRRVLPVFPFQACYRARSAILLPHNASCPTARGGTRSHHHVL
ncbi:LysR family transcriptional regulator [Pseudomonas ceruminis]|uniref:LysR family transcriptional regulator n=1 Tax=Pseudomonas ceruminis TaxID=2740516 RepID=UPI0040469C3C